VISLDYSMGIQIINFILLIFILNFLLYKPLLGLIDKRNHKIEASKAECLRLQKTIEQKTAAYEEKLRLAKADAIEKKNEIIRQGADEAKGIVDSARADLPALMEQFHTRMEGEILEARRILTGRSEKLSVEIAEKVLGRRLR
jgi:F-type H+-transporting ATPase subunit b